MTKQAIRSEVAARVKNLSPVYCREADEAICRSLLQSQLYQKARTVLCYVGRPSEINTMSLLRTALQDGKLLALPLCTPEKGVMEVRQISGLGDLVTGRFHILAPKLQCPLVSPEDIDLAVVPCATASTQGARLGYGGGYYDRVLLQTRCPVVALCRTQLLREDIPMEEFDVVMDYLVTEKGITACKA